MVPPIQDPNPSKPSPYYASTSRRHQIGTYTEKDYEEIYYHFEDYAGDIIIANASNILNPENPELYRWEELLLEEASEAEWEGLKYSCLMGVAGGVLSLCGLRFGRRWRSRSGLSSGNSMGGGGGSSSRFSGGYKFDPIPPRHDSNINPSNIYNHPNSNGGSDPSRFLFDVTLSTLLGIGVSLFALERDIFYPNTTVIKTGGNNSGNDNETVDVQVATPPPPWISPQIPLVPGRSILSDELCKPITREFRKFPKELWQSGNLNKGVENGYNNHMALYANGGWKDTKYYNNNPNASVVALGESGNSNGVDYATYVGNANDGKGVYESLVLDSLQGFVINCERRSRYEQKLRQIRGMKRDDDDVHVVIPKDGVPANEDLELDDIYLTEQSGANDDDYLDDFGLNDEDAS